MPSKPDKPSADPRADALLLQEQRTLEALDMSALPAADQAAIKDFLAFETSASWSLFSKSGSGRRTPCELYTTVDPSTQLYCSKGVTRLAIAPREAAQLFSGLEYFPRLNPLTKSIEAVDGTAGALYAVDRALRLVVRCVWPVADRELIFHGLNTISGDRSLAVSLNYFDAELSALHPDVPKNCVRAVLHQGGFIVRSVRRNGENVDDSGNVGNVRDGEDSTDIKSNENLEKIEKIEKIESDCDGRPPLSEVVFMVKIDLKGWVAMKFVNKMQAKQVKNLGVLLQEEISKYEEGKCTDERIHRIMRLRELRASLQPSVSRGK